MDEGLTRALSSLIGAPCERSLTTNALMLRFDFRERAKGRAYLWIYPPWRLTLDGKFVTGSSNWPVWDGVEEEEVNRPIWEAWCRLLDPLNATTLIAAVVGEPLPDLRLRFASGHEIEVFGDRGEDFGDRGEDYWWYYRDRVTGERFEAGAAGSTFDLREPLAG